MKKFTFISMLMLIVSTMAKAELMDKYFFKIPTDKMAAGWIIQDAGNFASTPGKEYLEVQNKKNGGRMLNYFWNEDAWAKTDVNNLPNNTYKFTMDLNMSNMDARADMEFVLLPVDACKSNDARVATHNQHWWNSAEGEDYFFRWRVGEKPAAANGDFTIWINENPTGKTDWAQTTEETLVISSQKLYKFAVEINVVDKTATYTIADADGNVLKTGVHNYVCAENRAGIMVFSMNGTSTHQLSNMGLSYQAEGPFANEPSVDLLGVIGKHRAYYVSFAEGETLHWKQLGDEEYSGNGYANGEEYTAEYWESNDTREFEIDTEETFGKKIIYCTESGQLQVWTSLSDDNVSEMVISDVVCGDVVMPTPKVTITNVNEGYAKEYTLTVDNSETLLKPEVTIHYVVKDAAGNKVEEKDVLTGQKVQLTSAGSIEMYAYDAKHPTPWYTQSGDVTVNNDVEYVQANYTNYAWTKEECETTKEGFTVREVELDIKNGAAQSRWERIYSNQKYGYDEAGNCEAWVDGKDYAFVKEGFGFFTDDAIVQLTAKWNTQIPDDATTAFAPLAPTADLIANSKYVADAWKIFPLEGIVYYNTDITNIPMTIDSKYVSDDASKPNFYVVHTRGGYDRPDKGDCNATTVCVAGEEYSLFRYDTAICDVKVMTYKGFVPGSGTGISSVNANETAPAVKKVMTNKGLVIVKGDKAYSVSGAQIK